MHARSGFSLRRKSSTTCDFHICNVSCSSGALSTGSCHSCSSRSNLSTSTPEVPCSCRSTTFDQLVLNANLQPPLRLHDRPLLTPERKLDYLHKTPADPLLTTMSALERVLSENPWPLQKFSTLVDFSGENIAFLSRLSIWWASCPETLDHERRIDAFNRALGIYVDFVSPRDAEFPLNLSSADLKPLKDVFERAARITCGEGRNDLVTPFDIEPTPASSSLGSSVQYTGEIPEGFCGGVFDDVQTHVKYLVFVNTWPKFVEAMHQPSHWSMPKFSYKQDTVEVARLPSTNIMDCHGVSVKRGEWKRRGIVFDNESMVRVDPDET